DNPLLKVDRNGKWPTKSVAGFDFRAHQYWIEQIFTARLSPQDIKTLQDAQVTADLDQQHQYKHAMSLPGQSPKEAIKQANAYVKATMDLAIANEKAGKHQAAMALLG